MGGCASEEQTSRPIIHVHKANDADTANEVNWNGRVRPTPSKSSFKVVFLGKSGVGKTSITLRFCRETFQDGTEATIGYVCSHGYLTVVLTLCKSLFFDQGNDYQRPSDKIRDVGTFKV